MPAPQATRADLALLASVPDVTYRQLRSWRAQGIGPQKVIERKGRGRVDDHYPDFDAAVEQLTACRDLSRRGRSWQVVALILAARGFPITDDAIEDAYRAAVSASVLCQLDAIDPDDDDGLDALDAEGDRLTNYVEDHPSAKGMRRSIKSGLHGFNDTLNATPVEDEVSDPDATRDDAATLRTMFGAALRLAARVPLSAEPNPVLPAQRLPSDAESLAAARGVDVEGLSVEERDERSRMVEQVVPAMFTAVAAAAQSMSGHELREAMKPARAALESLDLHTVCDAELFDLLVAVVAPIGPAMLAMLSALAA